MLVTLVGMEMLVKLEQPIKACAPMLSTLPGIVISVILEQPEKALSPILVTWLGMFMFAKTIQF